MAENRHRSGHVRNILAAYGLSWFWVVAVVTILQAVLPVSGAGIKMPVLSVLYALSGLIPSLGWLGDASSGLGLFMVLIFAPVIEEALFRLLPLTLVLDKHPDKIRAVQIAVCGIIFGWMHGSPLNVFIQGFVGLMLGWLFVKNYSSQWAAYFSCVIVHALYNFTVIMTAL